MNDPLEQFEPIGSSSNLELDSIVSFMILEKINKIKLFIVEANFQSYRIK